MSLNSPVRVWFARALSLMRVGWSPVKVVRLGRKVTFGDECDVLGVDLIGWNGLGLELFFTLIFHE